MKSNIWKLYLSSAFRSMIFFVPILVPFLERTGLTMQEILIVEGAFSAVVVILEIPSGYFADVYGRRKSMILGAFFFLLSMIGFAVADSFWGFIVAEILGGTGISFYSGANQALLYDSLVDLKRKKEYKVMQGNMFFYERISSVFANVAGGMMAFYFLRLPIYLSIVPAVIWVVLTLFLREPKRHGEDFEKWGHFVRIFKESFFGHVELRWFILYTAFPAGISLAAFWLFQGYMEFVALPIVFFGVLISLMNIVGAFMAKYAHVIEEKISLKGVIILVPVLFCVAWGSLAFLDSVWAVGLILLSSAAWGFSNPIFSDFVQTRVSSDRRATIMSVMSLFGRLMFVITAPIVGWVADLWDVQVALLASAAGLAVMSAVMLIMLRRVKVI